jgi:hypothetical protein
MKITLFLLMCSIFTTGQTIKKHQWKDRVLLIFAHDKNSEDLKNQWKLLLEDKNELADRKLVVYSFTKNEVRFNFEDNWKTSSDLYNSYIKNDAQFKILLIGLNGGIKIEEISTITLEKLFAIIDGMPMRRNELKDKN